jgi:hypothetical protein
MTNTIQQLKEEIMEELKPFIVGLQRPLYKQNTKEIEYIEEVGDELEERMHDVLDKVIKATAHAMVGEGLKRVYDGNDLESARVHYHRAFQNWDEVVRYEDGYKTRIAEEKALRDEITQ